MSLVTVTREEGLAVLTINNPPVNAFSRAVSNAVREAIVDIAASDARALLTLAEGDHFCAGADVSIFRGQDERSGAGLVANAISLITAFEHLPIPTVMAVQGVCIAAGMELLLAHDIVIAGSSAMIGQTEAMIGTTTLMGGAQRIVARAGAARAKEMVFSGKMYPAEVMERWNIVNQVVPDAELRSTAKAYAARLAKAATPALAAGKAIINATAAAGVGAGDRTLHAAAGQLFGTSDHQRAVEAFLGDGRAAVTKGQFPFEGR